MLTLALLLLWVVLWVYGIAALLDFGASAWGMFLWPRTAASIAAAYVSPFWELTNVFLVMLAVAIVGFFPRAAFFLGSVLLVPGSLILILLALRGTFVGYAYTTERRRRLLQTVSGITALLIPGLLVSVLLISQGGFTAMVGGRPVLLLGKLFSTPAEYAFLAFGLGMELFFSALFLADYARARGDGDAYREYRGHALRLGPLTLVVALGALTATPPEAGWMVPRLLGEWPLFALSLLAFGIGYGVLWLRRSGGERGYPRLAVLAVSAQLGLAALAYGRAHLPYMLYPYLTASASFVGGTMFQALLAVLIVGLLLFIPAFIWYWRFLVVDRLREPTPGSE